MAGKQITLAAWRDEKPVISGCEPVTGWTKYKGNIWKAPMNWTLGIGRNQVFADNEVMIEARYPNKPDKGLEMYVSDLGPLWPTFAEFFIPDPTENPGRVVSRILKGQPDDYWKGAIYYGVHFEGWAAQTGIIESSKSGEITVGDRTKRWWFDGGGGTKEEGRGMIVGHMNALDCPTEWHWQDNALYFIPKTAEPSNVEAKKRHLAFDLSGREHIHLTGLRVKAASMRLEDSAYCVIDGCHFAFISHYMLHYDESGQLHPGRDTVKSGETGIFVGGHDNAFLNCSVRVSAGAGFHLRGYHHTIHNCLIDEVDYTSHYLNAITDAFVVKDFGDYENMLVGGHVITYNTMCNAGRHFFNFSGNGTSSASRNRGPMDYMATLFAHNHLYNGMLQTGDGGLITGYVGSGGTLNGLRLQLAYNVIHDSYDICSKRINRPGPGIVYLDIGTCDVELHDNLLWAAPGSLQRGFWYNTECVNIRHHDNAFYSNFTRTVAELTPADFPRGKPFRFGHDFEHPPAAPAWPPVSRVLAEAGTATHSAGIVTVDGRLTGLKDGEWFSFDGVNSEVKSVVMRFASPVKEMNTDKSMRAAPRHRKATDPLVLDATINDGAEKSKAMWAHMATLEKGAWLKFAQVPLGDGYRRFRVVYGNGKEIPVRLTVHLDATNGPIVCNMQLPKTELPRAPGYVHLYYGPGPVQVYGEALGDVSADAAGLRDVYLVFENGGGKSGGDFAYFRFEQYRGSIALSENEVKIEVRTGSKDGEKIGEFYPRFTGDAAQFRDFVAPTSTVNGKQLFFVVRSAMSGVIGSVERMSFETAAMPATIDGLGVPPLMEGDEMVLPQPTNLPAVETE